MTGIYDMPGHLARRFQQIAVAAFRAEVSGAGYELTPVQFAALSAIRDHPGTDQATLAGLIAYDPVTLGGVVERLLQKALVTRRTNARDRRARELRLSPAGSHLLDAVAPAVAAAQAEMLRGLSSEETQELQRLLRKVIAAHDRRGPEPEGDPSPHPGGRANPSGASRQG